MMSTDKPKTLTLKKPLSLEQEARIVMTLGHTKIPTNQETTPPLPEASQAPKDLNHTSQNNKPQAQQSSKEQKAGINSDQDPKEDQQDLSQKQLKAAEKAAKRLKQQEYRQKIHTTLSWLKATYPACFDMTPPLPLKVGIGKDIITSMNTGDKTGLPSGISLKHALGFYTRSRLYHEAVISSSHRYDLTGNPAQEITEAEKTYARSRLKFLEEKQRLQEEKAQQYRERKQKQREAEQASEVTASLPNTKPETS